MRDTYLVGYDPQMKIWEVGKVFTEHPDDYWVFKTTARNEESALAQAVQQFQELCRPSAARISLYRHICKKTLGLMSYGTSMLTLEIPRSMEPTAEALIKQNMLIRGEGRHVLINTQGPLWKYLEQDFKHEVYAPRRDEVMEI